MLLASAMLVCLLQTPATAPTDVYLDVPLVPYVTPLQEPGRYRSPRSYDQTLDFYTKLFKQSDVPVRWRNVVNMPGIKAKHIESLRAKTRWEGINIYEYKGQVRLFIIPRNDSAGKKE